MKNAIDARINIYTGRRRASESQEVPPTCVELHVAVPAPLVFEQAAAEGALERQLVAVDLLVALQVAQTAEGGGGGAERQRRQTAVFTGGFSRRNTRIPRCPPIVCFSSILRTQK